MSFALVCLENPPVKVFVERTVTCQVRKFVKSLERKGTCRNAGSKSLGVSLYVEVASIGKSCHSFEDLNSTFERIRKSSVPLNLPEWGGKDLCALFARFTHTPHRQDVSSKTSRFLKVFNRAWIVFSEMLRNKMFKSELNKVKITLLNFTSFALRRF